MVSAIESTIDQARQPGMKRTCVRSVRSLPDHEHVRHHVAARCRHIGIEFHRKGRVSFERSSERDAVFLEGKCEKTPPITARTCSSAISLPRP